MEIFMNKELFNRKYLPLPPLNAFTTGVIKCVGIFEFFAYIYSISIFKKLLS